MRGILWVLAGALLITPTGCGRDAREWTPSDHDEAPSAGQAAPGAKAPSPAEQQAQLIDVAWAKQCARCHGAQGRGDGPEGPMVKAPDLTKAAWQASVTDEQIARTIMEGKGKMPKFDLPPAVIAGLLKRVRQSKAP